MSDTFLYQYTINAFSTDEFSVGPLSFPQETVDVVYSHPINLLAPIEGISYNVQNGALTFLFFNKPDYLIFYPPGSQPLLNPNTSTETGGVFKINVFTHPEYDTFFVGGTIATARAQPPPVSTAEPAALPLLLLGLGVAWLIARFRARMRGKE